MWKQALQSDCGKQTVCFAQSLSTHPQETNASPATKADVPTLKEHATLAAARKDLLPTVMVLLVVGMLKPLLAAAAARLCLKPYAGL